MTHPIQKKGAAFMKIESVLDPAFAAYGQVVTGLEEARAEILAAPPLLYR